MNRDWDREKNIGGLKEEVERLQMHYEASQEALGEVMHELAGARGETRRLQRDNQQLQHGRDLVVNQSAAEHDAVEYAVGVHDRLEALEALLCECPFLRAQGPWGRLKSQFPPIYHDWITQVRKVKRSGK